MARIQHDVEPSNAAILSRLTRLEEMILRMNQAAPSTPDSLSIRHHEHEIVPPLTPTEASHQLESQQLTNIGTEGPRHLPAMSTSYIFETVAMTDIEQLESTLIEHSDGPLKRRRKMLVPVYSDARCLFDQYAKYICHFHQIIHLPTFLRTMEKFYLDISQGKAVNTDHAALVLSVLATVLGYSKWSEPDSSPFQFASNRDITFLILFRSALDLLEYSRRVLSGSVEIVQTAIIIVFIEYNLEGFTSRARALLAQALLTAQELSMHKIDCPSSTRRRESSTSVKSLIETEMKRRIWWHLVATDWMISLAGGPQEGIYSAHPQQMRVRLPRNIDDEVLDRGNATEDLPLTQPTVMNYPLHRVRLAELSRTAIDTLRFGLADPTEHDYAQIMQLDRRIQNFIEDLPIFLKLDEESVKKSQNVLDRYPFFAMQRYIINLGVYSVRCKIHQPFLMRSNAREQYSQSENMCISSAVKVIEISKAIRADPTHYIPVKVKVRGLMHHLFLATVVLAMDLCFNRMYREEDPRKQGVSAAIEMLEDAKDESAHVHRFLDSLTEALRKHQVRFREDATSLVATQYEATGPTWLSAISGQVPAITAAGVSNPTQTTLLGFEDVWQQDAIFEDGMPAMPDWDQLFSELDTFIA
ncbi:hypothetical protein LTS08_001341 [Lithohypha guttulata]|uniref:uncharacterized protein n=1 Tax=Lithohypha guttulata TaxID=1690604 RepID=UPI002DDDBF06|nr:hypothetical protein LTR51_003993 [Lithohypha guttulata]KAK5105067.1 hypothetical protein LTS08_001341 [Lithohypha guttulata]